MAAKQQQDEAPYVLTLTKQELDELREGLNVASYSSFYLMRIDEALNRLDAEGKKKYKAQTKRLDNIRDTIERQFLDQWQQRRSAIQ